MGRAEWLLLVSCGRIGFGSLGDGNTGDGPPQRSCTNLPPTCGPLAASSCCANSVVVGGSFYRSYDLAADGMYPMMTNPASVSDFRLDTYEVTVGRFRRFVDAGMERARTRPPPAPAHMR
jgi:hypothetical protein